jgi:hypothetical protein
MYSSSAKATKHSLGRFSFLALGIFLASLPIPCQAASKPASTPGCTVQATNYQGWKAEQMANRWVKLEIVPQLGGRLMQVTFGGHDFLYVNPGLQGKIIPVGTRGGHNYGGDKIWPLPEGNNDEQHWEQSTAGPLDTGAYTLQVLSRGAKCAVRLTGPPDPSIGQRYIREFSIGADSPVISFHNVMQNVTGFPQTWSEQTITEYPMSNPSGSDNLNTKFYGVTALNPTSAYPNGYQVRTGPQQNDAYAVSDGTLRVHWNNISQEVWIDTPTGWLAAVDGTSGYTMVERHQIDPAREYPGKATIIVYSSGAPRRRTPPPGSPTPTPAQNQNAGQREGPFMEAEVNSPMVELAPGESYALDTTWYPTRMGEDFKTTTYAGVIGTPLTAAATPAGLVLSGSFGVFYAGDLVAHYYDRGGSEGSTAKLLSVTPIEPVQLHTTVQAPPGTSRVSVHLVDAQGLDRGPLGEVLVNPPPPRSPPRQQ